MLSLNKTRRENQIEATSASQFCLQLWDVDEENDTFEFLVPFRDTIKSNLLEQNKPYFSSMNFRFEIGVLANKDHALHVYLDASSVTVILSLKDEYKGEEGWEPLISSDFKVTLYCNGLPRSVAPIQTMKTAGPRIHPGDPDSTYYTQNWVGDFQDDKRIFWDGLVDKVRIKLNHSGRNSPALRSSRLRIRMAPMPRKVNQIPEEELVISKEKSPVPSEDQSDPEPLPARPPTRRKEVSKMDESEFGVVPVNPDPIDEDVDEGIADDSDDETVREDDVETCPEDILEIGDDDGEWEYFPDYDDNN